MKVTLLTAAAFAGSALGSGIVAEPSVGDILAIRSTPAYKSCKIGGVSQTGHFTPAKYCKGISDTRVSCYRGTAAHKTEHIPCCVEVKCAKNKGLCRSQVNNGCDGGKFSGKDSCPGDSDIQCCVGGGPDSTSWTEEASGFGATILAKAKLQAGVKYAWGGGQFVTVKGKTTFKIGAGLDCSGLVVGAVFAASGGKIKLPRVTYGMYCKKYKSSEAVFHPVADRQPGDLVFIGDACNCKLTYQQHVDRYQKQHIADHMGILMSGSTIWNAPHTGTVVRADTYDPEEFCPMVLRITKP